MFWAKTPGLLEIDNGYTIAAAIHKVPHASPGVRTWFQLGGIRWGVKLGLNPDESAIFSLNPDKLTLNKPDFDGSFDFNLNLALI